MLKLLGKITIPPVVMDDTASVTTGAVAVPEEGVDMDISIWRSVDDHRSQHDRATPPACARRRLIHDTVATFAGASWNDGLWCSEDRIDGSVLVFRDVDPHVDQGLYLYRKDEFVQPRKGMPVATFSIVLFGTCALHLNRKQMTHSIALTPGDVYVFDQQLKHSVTDSNGPCIHLTTSVPLFIARTLASTVRPTVRRITVDASAASAA